MRELLQAEPGRKLLLMGNEAIARGALEAGVDLVAAYPGTPSSEIGETLARVSKQAGIYVEWSINEKVAFDVAAGASLVGARALVAMKNAGLNVAMDTFMTLPYGGVRGGLVVVVADDPDAHYSSTEQDTRPAAVYAEIPCLEPADQQEAKDMTVEAFRLSEQLELPVFLRSVSRISHASGDVSLGLLPGRRRKLGFNKHWKLPYRWNVYGPPGAVSKHRWVHEQLEQARAYAERCAFNRLELVPGAELGVIASGVAAAYVREALAFLGVRAHLLTLGLVHPLADGMVRGLLSASRRVLVVEEGDPTVETQVRVLAQEVAPCLPIFGKLHVRRVLPSWGELNPALVRQAFMEVVGVAGGSIAGTGSPGRAEARARAAALVVPRSSTLCAGCSHLGSYWALRQALARRRGVHIVNGDIGCYEQGGYGIFSRCIEAGPEESRRWPTLSPYEILDTNYVMGGGIGLAQGQVQAGYREGKVVAVAGDSTFTHATLPAVLNAAYNKADITFLVLANNWTAMTGHQPNPTTGVTAMGDQVPVLNIEQAARALGVSDVHTASAYDLTAARRAIEKALDHAGPSVVILTGECQLQVQRRNPVRDPVTRVEREKCNGCRLCVQLGCPAVTFDAGARKAGIDPGLCVDCGLCRQVCVRQAIVGPPGAAAREGE